MNKPKKPNPPLKRDFQSCNEIIFIPNNYEKGELSLQSIIDSVPKNIPLKNIYVSYDCNDDSEIQVYYYNNKPERIKEFETAREQYKLDKEQYESDKKIYAEFFKTEKIKDLEKEIKRLKK